MCSDDVVFLYERLTKKTQIVTVGNNDTAPNCVRNPSTSADGRFVAWDSDQPYVPADTNETWDVYRRGPMHGCLTAFARQAIQPMASRADTLTSV